MDMDALETRRTDRSVPLLIAAGVLVVVAIVLLVTMGIKRPPVLEPIGAGDELPTESIVRFAYQDEGPCVEIVAPSGEVRELTCDVEGGEVLGWKDGTIALRTYSNVGEEIVLLDADSGSVLARELIDPMSTERLPSPVYSVVRTTNRDATFTVRLARDNTLLWSVDAPSSYRIDVSAVTADGTWVAMVDNARRLLLVRADGSAPPRVWIEDIGSSWDAIVWEGTGTMPD